MYITKKESLCRAIEDAIKKQINTVEEIIGSVVVLDLIKENGLECHEDEIEKCASGSFNVLVRVFNSCNNDVSEVQDISGRFTDVSYEYKESRHTFFVGSVSI